MYTVGHRSVVYLDLICLVSSHKWQACRIEGAIAIMHVHGWPQSHKWQACRIEGAIAIMHVHGWPEVCSLPRSDSSGLKSQVASL